MNIKDFLKLHPLISPLSIERTLNIPRCTISLTTNRHIPDKYNDLIIDLLKEYGYDKEVLIEASNEPENDIKKDTKYFIRDKCVVLYKDNGLNKRVNLPDDTPIYI